MSGAPHVESCDVAVVGAGPAGSTTARELARSGLDVVLVDRQRFPRAKVCGACLHPRALEELGALDLGGLPERLGAHRLTRLRVAARGRVLSTPLARSGAVLSREALDAALVEAAVAAGARVWLGSAAELARADERAPERELAVGARRLVARVVVAADGLGGALLRRTGELELAPRRAARVGVGARCAAGLEDELADGEVLLAVGAAGYAGLVRLEDGALDVAAALAPSALERHGAARAVRDVLLAAGAPVPDDLEHARWRGTPPLARHLGPAAAQRAFAVGDAAGYVEPFSGEGLAWAFAGARVLAPIVAAVARGELAPERAAAAWEQRRAEVLGSRQRASLAIAALARWPGAVSLLAAGAAHAPRLSRRAVALAWGAREARGVRS